MTVKTPTRSKANKIRCYRFFFIRQKGGPGPGRRAVLFRLKGGNSVTPTFQEYFRHVTHALHVHSQLAVDFHRIAAEQAGFAQIEAT